MALTIYREAGAIAEVKGNPVGARRDSRTRKYTIVSPMSKGHGTLDLPCGTGITVVPTVALGTLTVIRLRSVLRGMGRR